MLDVTSRETRAFGAGAMVMPWMADRRALVIGIAGQDGSLLAELLLAEGYEVFGVVRQPVSSRFQNLDPIRKEIELSQADVLDELSLVDVLSASRPQEVYNLAAPSFVPMSWRQPVLTAEFAAVGCTALLEAIRRADDGIRFYQASSSEIFGDPREVPQNEETPLQPVTPYGVAKAYAHFITRSYRRRYGLHASSGILYNHESPRRPLDFVTRKVTNAAAAISLGLQNELALGDLDARRDWGYAADYVRAMWLILQEDEPDDYVIASGTSHSVRELVDLRVRARRARLGGVRARRRVARPRQGRAPRPRRRPVEGARASRVGADARLRGSRSPARRQRRRTSPSGTRAHGRRHRMTVAVAGSARSLLAPVGRPLRRALVGARTRGWPDHSHLVVAYDAAGWVLEYEAGHLERIAVDLDIRLAPNDWAGSVTRQSVFHLSQFTLLLGDFERRGNRIGVSYFHGRPGTPGMPEFDECFATLRRRHGDVDRVQVTNLAMETLVLETGIAAEKVHRIPIGIDVDAFPLRSTDSTALAREAFDIPSTAFVVGSFQKDGVGWEDGAQPKLIKGPDTLLDVLELVHARVPELFVLLTGPARGYVRAGLERLGIPHRHVLLPDIDSVARAYAAIDVCLVTSRDEGGPRAVLESMATGVPRRVDPRGTGRRPRPGRGERVARPGGGRRRPRRGDGARRGCRGARSGRRSASGSPHGRGELLPGVGASVARSPSRIRRAHAAATVTRWI